LSFHCAFHDISVAQLALVAAVAFVASLVGGVLGYGTGALMPLVLVPLIGAEPVVPIMAFVEHMPIHVHTAVLDAVVLIGGLFLVLHAFR